MKSTHHGNATRNPGRAKVDPLRAARTCYGHLAGRLGVAVTDSLRRQGLIRLAQREYRVTRKGEAWFGDFGLDPVALRKQRRRFAYPCLDCSERVPHIGGALGDALAARMFELGWIRRTRHRRGVRVTESGRRALQERLGVRVPPSPPIPRKDHRPRRPMDTTKRMMSAVRKRRRSA